jgi:OOP family OmpA-OmpF porin
MKKSVKVASLVATALVTASATSVAFSQPAKPPLNKGEGGYWGNVDRLPWQNVSGNCWRGTGWSPANAQPGCDEDLIPKAPPPPPPAPAPARPVTPPPPPPPPRPAPPPPAPTSEKVTFAADAFFDFDKAVVKPEGKAKLDDLAGKLKGIALEVIIAVGHTDSVGSDAYNQRLSVRRSEAVKAYLVSKGIEANRVYTEGKGEKQPVADNKTAAGRAKNRRVEIEVVGTRPRR